MTYHHLNVCERNFIQKHLNLSHSQRWIAGRLGRSVSSVSRDVRRNGGLEAYDAVGAGTGASTRRRRGLLKLAEGTVLREYVLTHIRKGWSPQQICGNLKHMDDMKPVSHETIYSMIYVLPRGEIRKEIIGLLRRGHKLRRPRAQGKDRRGGIKDMVSIHERPDHVLSRELFGHWEGDLIKGAGNASAIGTLVERKSRFTILAKMANCSADAALKGFGTNLNRVPQFMRETLTYDQGTEMAQHKELAKRLKIKVYFCDPHSPWQRPTNENTNGLIRQYLPKGIDLSIYSQSDLNKIAESLNTRPRKCLDFRTPQKVFNMRLTEPCVALQI